jgi:hypothetical protein
MIRQFLVLRLDEKLSLRSSRLFYEICKARGILPASCIVQLELTHISEFGWSGVFAEVSRGEHQERPMATKHLRIGTKDEINKVYKVSTGLYSGPLVWDSPLDEPRAAGSNPVRLKWPFISPVIYKVTPPLVLESSHSHFARCSAFFCRSVTCGFP